MEQTLILPRLVVGGATSGVGKTTLVAGLCAALRARGLVVQPFKCGPDYIDPGYHATAAGRPCRNLDSWMLPASTLTHLFARAAGDADLSLIEGVMGLYDGRGLEAEGSTASVARALEAPVLLVVDASKTAQSLGALVLGYRSFDPAVRIVGVVLNQVGSPNHLRTARAAIEGRAGVPVVGYLSRHAELHLPERHLGLVPTAEDESLAASIKCIREQVESTVDVAAVLRLAQAAGPLALDGGASPFPPQPVPTRATIGVAQDEAFNFYYEDNLDLLRAWGAELVPVSPLHDEGLPASLQGLYIGGGFPELYAGRLAANAGFTEALRRAVAAGLPVYAECGGLMYLSQGIATFEGDRHPGVGIVPGWCVMQQRRVRLGYVVAEALQDSLLARRGQRLRGHAFHWSRQEGQAAGSAYRLLEPVEEDEGYARGNLLASYLHLHFGSQPDLAPRFVAACAARAGTQRGKRS